MQSLQSAGYVLVALMLIVVAALVMSVFIAGSVFVVTLLVPPGALGVARERQRNVEGYDRRKRAEEEKRREADVD